MKRRDFVKTLSAAGVAMYASDLVGDLVAQSPRGQVLQSRFKGLSDTALGEAKRLVAHGGWLAFVRQCGLTVRTAQGYMRAASLPDDDPRLNLALRDLQKVMATPKTRPGPAPPATFPISNIANLRTGPCRACGRACACAPASAAGIEIDDDEAA